MNAQNITNITITLSDNTTKTINVADDGMVLILGRCTKTKDATECSVKELIDNAKGEITESQPVPVPFDEKLAAANKELQQSQAHNYFEAAVEFLANLTADEFLELVLFSKEHGNKFPKFCRELCDCANADDVYCSTLICLARPRGEETENVAFKLLADCLEAEQYAPVFNTFKRVWESLKTLRELTECQVTSLTIE